jgi:hypothetical protein
MVKAGLSRSELRKLEGDDEITAASDTRREAVIATPWHLEAGDGKEATGPDVDFILEQITPWLETMARAAWARCRSATRSGRRSTRISAASARDRAPREKPFEWFRPQTMAS